MNKEQEIGITGIGMITPVGLTALSTAAAIRAGIARFRETPYFDGYGLPIAMGTVPDQFFEHDALDGDAEDPNGDDFWTTRTSRIVRLGTAAVRQCLRDARLTAAPPLLWAAQEPLPGFGEEDTELLDRLARRLGAQIDREQSALFPLGRAGGAIALQEAIDRLTSGAANAVLVGGADSYFDPDLLAQLDSEERLRSTEPRDAMVIGEGAACLLLTTTPAPRHGRLLGVGIADEPGHRYSETANLCSGLDSALKHALRSSTEAAVKTVYGSLNGESLQGREWGVALLRNRAAFTDGCQLHHPFDCIGDVGAASMPLLIGLALLSAARAGREHPTLVWCASDGIKRGAAILAA